MRPLLTDFSLNMRTKVDHWQDRASLRFALRFCIKALRYVSTIAYGLRNKSISLVKDLTQGTESDSSLLNEQLVLTCNFGLQL